MFFASIILWLFSMLNPQGHISVKTNLKGIIVAGVLLGIHFALFFSAIKITKIANATFLGTLAPFFTLLIEIFILKRIFNKKILLGLVFTFIGSLIIIGYQFSFSTTYATGNVLAILCSLCLGIAFIISEKIRKDELTIVYTRTLYFVAACTLLTIGIISDVEMLNYSFNEYLGLLFLGIVPTILGHNSIYYAVKYVSPTIVAAFPVGEPIIATILAYLIFGELITLNIIIGGVFTFSGLILISIYKNLK